MADVIGLTANKKIHPIIKDVVASVKKILKFEKPNTFNDNRSREFLICKRNHMLDIKMIKGSNFIIIFGI